MVTKILLPLTTLGAALALAASAPVYAATPNAAADRESTLRFPESVVKNNAAFAERDPDPDYRHASAAAYEAFRDMKFGVRIHWGLYSLLPVSRESWTFLELSDAERQAYIESTRRWNPQGFEAEQWMQFFERAGFQCFAMTTKHHEGFSLWDTKTRVYRRPNYTAPGGLTIEDCDVAYSVMETPFKRDIIKELCDAGHRHGLKINLYFSHTDWYDADFRPYGRHPLQYDRKAAKSLEDRQKRPAVLVPAPTPQELARRHARHQAQLRELLTNFGQIDMVCLDIALGEEDWPAVKDTIKQLRQLQPNVMFRNRGIGNYGDYHTPERVVPGDKSTSAMPWMVIYPLGSHFSYEGDPAKHKGAKWVVDNLVDSVAKGGNFMVGIGPDGSGRFHPTAIAQLEEVGAWLKINGEGIYATRERAGERWKEGADVRFTQSKDGKNTYVHLLQRPSGPVRLKSLGAAPGAKVTLLGRPEPLAWRTEGDELVIDFPAQAREALAYTIKVAAP